MTFGLRKVSSFLKRAAVIAVGVVAFFAPGGARADALQPSGGDDFAAIQAAIDAAGRGGKVVLASGDWKISKTLSVTNGVTLAGATDVPADVTLKTSKSGVAWATVSDGVVSGIAFHGASGKLIPALLVGAGGTVTNCIVRNCNVTDGSNAAAVIQLNGAGALMTHCVVTNNTNAAGPGNGNCRICSGVCIENGTLAWSLVADNNETYLHENSVGGVFLRNGFLLNCTIANNVAYGCGGIFGENLFSRNGIASNCVVAANVAKLNTSYNGFKGDKSRIYECLTDVTVPGATCEQAAAYNIFRDLAHRDYRGNVGFSTVNGHPVGCYPVPAGKLVAGFASTAVSGALPLTVTLTAAVSGASGTVSYAWDLDGDGVYEDTTSGASVDCTFTTAGSHTVGLKVTDDVTHDELDRKDFITALPKTMYVKKGNTNADYPYDNENNAAADIQTAVDAAIDGCTVRVLSDSFTVTTPVTVGKGVTLRSESGKPEDLVLTCGTAAKSAVMLNHGSARLEGVTVKGATGACAGAIYIDSLGGTVSNCVVRGCTFSSTGSNNGASIYATGSDALVTHCVVTNNRISTGCSNNNGRKCAGMTLWSGAKASNCLVADCKYTDSPNAYSPGGIYAKQSYVYNCTVVDCVGTACGGIWSDSSGGIYNCVIAGCNANNKGDGYHSIYSGTGARYYYCAADTEIINGTSCQKDDAANLFKSYANGNYAPKPGSVLVGNGKADITVLPETDLAGAPRLSEDGKIDIGAYQSQLEFAIGLKASGTAFLAPCRVKFEAEVSGVPAGDEISYEWTVGDQVTTESASVKYVDIATAQDVTVSVRAYDGTLQKWSPSSDPSYVHVVPKKIWVNLGNEKAQAPYDAKGKGAADFQTILDYAVDGCEILIAEGRHPLTVDVEIAKSVTLRGERDDPEATVFLPTSGRLPFVLKAGGAVLANVAVEGLSGSGTAIKVDNLGGTVSNCVVRKCSITGHRADFDQTSVVAAFGKLARVTRCVITNNTQAATPGNTNFRRGPGLSLHDGARADNCLIAANTNVSATANEHLPGGVYIDNGTLVNCTVVSNYGFATGGVWIDSQFGGGVIGSITNCVMAGNGCKVVANDSNFLAAKQIWATGFTPFTASPVACATDTVKLGDDSVVGTMRELFRLRRRRPYAPRTGSPLIDAGAGVSQAIDFLGNPRPFGRRFDIGCYESQLGGLTVIVR